MITSKSRRIVTRFLWGFTTLVSLLVLVSFSIDLVQIGVSNERFDETQHKLDEILKGMPLPSDNTQDDDSLRLQLLALITRSEETRDACISVNHRLTADSLKMTTFMQRLFNQLHLNLSAENGEGLCIRGQKELEETAIIDPRMDNIDDILGGHSMGPPQPLDAYFSFPEGNKPGGCTRIPALALAPWGLVYTFNTISGSCHDHASSTQHVFFYVFKKEVSLTAHMISHHILGAPYNRKSCSIAAGMEPGSARLLCTNVDKAEWEISKGKGPGDVVFDIFEAWSHNKTIVIRIPRKQDSLTMMSLFPGAGTAIWEGGDVFIPVYGMSESLNQSTGGVFCPTDTCPTANQESCMKALTNQDGFFYYGAIMVLSADGSRHYIKALPISVFGGGGEMSLERQKNSYILYKRSAGWYRGIQLWEIPTLSRFGDATRIPFPELLSNGYGKCAGRGVCPQWCISGTLNAPFVVRSGATNRDNDYYIWAALLNNLEKREDLRMFWRAPRDTRWYSSYLTANGGAAYSHTKGFIFESKVYILSVRELMPATMGQHGIHMGLYEISRE